MKKKALEKLTVALEDVLKGVKNENDAMAEAMRQQSTILIRYIMKRCVESESMAADVAQAHKTWERCMKYVTDHAREYAVRNVAVIPDSTVYEWAEDYFHLDDKEQVEKEEKEAAEKKAKQEQAAAEKKAKVEKRKAAAEKKKAKEAKEAEAAKTSESKKTEENDSTSESENDSEEPSNTKPAAENSDDIDGQMDIFSFV